MSWDKPMPARPVVAVAGATGAVGREMLLVLEQRGFPAERVIALASPRSAGKVLPFGGGELVVEELTPASFDGVDIALFWPAASVSKAMREAVVGAGCVVSTTPAPSAWTSECRSWSPRSTPTDVGRHSGIIANPNCSTIQMVVALKPLHGLAPSSASWSSTYQAASGPGSAAMDELDEQTARVPRRRGARQSSSSRIGSPSTASRTSTSSSTTAPPRKSGRWSSRPGRSCTRPRSRCS